MFKKSRLPKQEEEKEIIVEEESVVCEDSVNELVVNSVLIESEDFKEVREETIKTTNENNTSIVKSISAVNVVELAEKLTSLNITSRRQSCKPANYKKKLDIDDHLLTLSEITTKYSVAVNPKQPNLSSGLSDEEVNTRKLKYGLNLLTKPKKKSPFIKFFECLANLFNVILIGSGFMNLILYFWDAERNFANSYIGGILIAVAFFNTFIEFWQIQKISAMVSSYTNLIPSKCQVIRNGLMCQIFVKDLVPGDVVFTKLGDKVPADMVLFHATDLKLDNSTLTGESEVQERIPIYNLAKTEETQSRGKAVLKVEEKKSISEDPWEAENLVFSGTVIVGGEGYGIVLKTGDAAAIGQIAKLTQNEKLKQSPLSKEIRRFCKLITMLASATSLVFFIFAWARGRTFNYALQFGIGILLAWLPQGLPLTVTMLLAISGQRLTNLNVLVKDLYGVETLGAITMLCTDKTGTITMNQMTVTNVWTNLTLYYAGTAKIDIRSGERPLRIETSGVGQILHIAATCTRAKFDGKNLPPDQRVILGDPTDSGLLRWAALRLKNIDRLQDLYPKVFEAPFTSETKYHMTIHRKSHKEGGLTLQIKGAPEVILDLCTHIFVDGESILLKEKEKKLLFDAYDLLAKKGHRVLGFAQFLLPGSKFPDNFKFSPEKRNWPADGYTYLGLVSLEDPPKEGVKEAVQKMKLAGIKVVMITGDHPLTAEAISRRVGIITGHTKKSLAQEQKRFESDIKESEYGAVVLTGDRLFNLTQEEWDAILCKQEVVFARTSPKQKLEIVTRAQSMGHIVGVTGDGVNDAAALKMAHLGIAMNKTGSDVSKDAAKMILLDDNFATIVNGIFEGRLIFLNLKKSIQYTLTHIMPEVIPYLLFVLVPIPLTLTAIQILIVDLGFEIITTLSFGWEPEEIENMFSKIRPRKEVTVETVLQLRKKEAERKKYMEDAKIGVINSNININDNYNSKMDLGSNNILAFHEISEEENMNFRVTNTRWKKYFFTMKEMTKKKYWQSYLSDWKELVNEEGKTDERLVDTSVLCWAYLEGGLLECLGCLVTYFTVLNYGFGITLMDAVHAQSNGKTYFRPESPNLKLESGKVLDGKTQVEALRQAQSAFYLSILIMQIFNLFVSKARYTYPFGKFVFKNNKSWYSILFGTFFGVFIVYTPGVSDFFVMSPNLDPLYLLIPLSFGCLLFMYSVLRRFILSIGWQLKLPDNTIFKDPESFSNEYFYPSSTGDSISFNSSITPDGFVPTETNPFASTVLRELNLEDGTLASWEANHGTHSVNASFSVDSLPSFVDAAVQIAELQDNACKKCNKIKILCTASSNPVNIQLSGIFNGGTVVIDGDYVLGVKFDIEIRVLQGFMYIFYNGILASPAEGILTTSKNAFFKIGAGNKSKINLYNTAQSSCIVRLYSLSVFHNSTPPQFPVLPTNGNNPLGVIVEVVQNISMCQQDLCTAMLKPMKYVKGIGKLEQQNELRELTKFFNLTKARFAIKGIMKHFKEENWSKKGNLVQKLDEWLEGQNSYFPFSNKQNTHLKRRSLEVINKYKEKSINTTQNLKEGSVNFQNTPVVIKYGKKHNSALAAYDTVDPISGRKLPHYPPNPVKRYYGEFDSHSSLKSSKDLPNSFHIQSPLFEKIRYPKIKTDVVCRRGAGMCFDIHKLSDEKKDSNYYFNFGREGSGAPHLNDANQIDPTLKSVRSKASKLEMLNQMLLRPHKHRGPRPDFTPHINAAGIMEDPLSEPFNLSTLNQISSKGYENNFKYKKSLNKLSPADLKSLYVKFGKKIELNDYGVEMKLENCASGSVFPRRHITEVILNEILEKKYNRCEIGKKIQTAVKLPDKVALNENHIFGLLNYPVDSAKEVIYNNDFYESPQKENKNLKNLKRVYELKSDLRGGIVNAKKLNDSHVVGEFLEGDYENMKLHHTPIANLKLEKFKEKFQPQLEKVYDPIRETMDHLPPDFTFGYTPKKDNVSSSDLIYQTFNLPALNASINEQALTKKITATRFGGGEDGVEDVVLNSFGVRIFNKNGSTISRDGQFGAYTVKDYLKKGHLKPLGDNNNYGDELDVKRLLKPTVENLYGITNCKEYLKNKLQKKFDLPPTFECRLEKCHGLVKYRPFSLTKTEDKERKLQRNF
ncbi:hypothetical protein HDU92_003912 [Lobulomyces angularis]|nr:hypothetical protein HDU92_003912 [Lobulomyces angularis]